MKMARRPNYGGIMPITVGVDGIALSTITPASTQFESYCVSFQATASTATLALSASPSDVDATSAVDAIRIRPQLVATDVNWGALQDKLEPYLRGKTTPITIVTFGNSHGTGQGTSAANQPGEQLKAVLQSFLPGVSVVHRNYAVPGSWQAQMGEQIDKMVGDAVAPDIALVLDPANDGLTSIFNGLEGPNVYRDRLGSNIRRLRAAGAVVLSHTTPLPHPTRSLARGRFDFSPDFFATYPTTSWVAIDGYQNFTFDAIARTISSSTRGQFTIFSPGWVAPGRWLRGNDNGAFHRITAVDSTGTTVTVDNGNGGPSFTSNRTTTAGMWVARIDAKTQLVPARNEDDLGRPAGVASDVPLALERRDINGNGGSVLASTRHLSLNEIARQVTTQEGAILVDWGADFQKLLTSDAAYDGLYPNNDDFHPGEQGYRLLTPIYRQLIEKALPAGTTFPTSWSVCAQQNQACAVYGEPGQVWQVRYGSDPNWSNSLTFTLTGSYAAFGCQDSVFGDPYPGVAKHCEARRLP
jgi:hypothetical protein